MTLDVVFEKPTFDGENPSVDRVMSAYCKRQGQVCLCIQQLNRKPHSVSMKELLTLWSFLIYVEVIRATCWKCHPWPSLQTRWLTKPRAAATRAHTATTCQILCHCLLHVQCLLPCAHKSPLSSPCIKPNLTFFKVKASDGRLTLDSVC